MNVKTVIFDLDGTLLNTLDDLAASTNAALRRYGYPTRTTQEVRHFVGNGVERLMLRALNISEPSENPQFAEIFAAFQAHYAVHGNDHTCAYDGVTALLEQLHAAGIKLAIVSNKPDAAVRRLNEIYFKDYITVAIGENEAAGVRKKPAPDTVFTALRALGADAAEAVYVGDSEVDIATARNAGLPCLSVTWGFREAKLLREQGAEVLYDTPQELAAVLAGGHL